MEEQIIRKIKFSGDKDVINFAREKLPSVDIAAPFLEHQTIRLKQALSKI